MICQGIAPVGAPAVGAVGAGIAEFHADFARETVIGFNNARFHHHLAGGHIKLFNQLLEFLNHGAVVGDDQGVGGRVDQGAAAAAQQGVAVAAATGAVFINAQNFAEFFYVFVFQLEGLREKRPQLFDFFLRLQGGFVLIQQFFARGDIDDIALAAHIEIARLHYQIQRLIPRHIFQAEGHFAVYAVAGHNIHA